MPNGPGSACRSAGHRLARAIWTLTVPVALVTAAASPAAAAAAQTPECTGLTVTGPTGQATTGRGVQAFATAPQELAGLDLPPSAFSATAAGLPLPLSTHRVTGSDIAITLVVAADLATPAADYTQARIAARELLVQVPIGARIALVSGSGAARIVTPLAARPDLALVALGGLAHPTGPRTPAQAVLLASQVTPAGGHVVLLSDAADDGDLATQRAAANSLAQRGVTLDRITYGPDSDAAAAYGATLTGDGCAASSASQPLLSRVDTIVARLRGEYQLDTATATDPAAITFTLNAAGSIERTTLNASSFHAAQPGATRPPALSAPDDTSSHWYGGRRLPLGALLALILGVTAHSRHERRRAHNATYGW